MRTHKSKVVVAKIGTRDYDVPKNPFEEIMEPKLISGHI